MDNSTKDQNLFCTACNKKFCSILTRNRHMKNIHKIIVSSCSKQKSHIKCPLCPIDNKVSFKNYNILNEHFAAIHQIIINEHKLTFENREQFDNWMSFDKKKVKYVLQKTSKGDNYTVVTYNCNRSNSVGYESKANQRMTKIGGSIKIQGVCPSRIIVKFIINGKVQVDYYEKHVGHTDEIRSQRLTKVEQEEIAMKLKAGVSNKKIISDAKELKKNKLEKINFLNRHDLSYIRKKFNIDNRRDPDDMVAVAMKVEEWNKDGRNYAFLFKKIGECHPKLNKEDFALGYMNAFMERKLKDFPNIICMDGTHGTNIRKFELTIMQIKDHRNAGFPVAFFLSNRQDQLIQEVYIEALKQRIGENICPEYFMTDDDPKYYNAWMKEMGNIPRRLLCTWHVIKNWNIKGKSKIKEKEIKEAMRGQMYRIMTATKIEEFEKRSIEYFQELREANEMDFLNYLKRYYFQNEERIKMWAHCHRINAGINTNMALESLNKFLKYDLLEGNARVTVEKLLDALDEIVNEKMWKTLANVERPTSNNYQDRTVIKAHKRAEECNMENIEEIEPGKFRVKSSKGNIFYSVLFNSPDVCNCLTVMCRVCEMCIHKYKCECTEYVVKSTMCKHVHMVALYERQRACGAFVSATSTEDDNLIIEEMSEGKLKFQEASQEFLEEKKGNDANEETLDKQGKKKVELEEAFLRVCMADEEDYKKCIAFIFATTKKVPDSCKRKIDPQSYYPAKKKKS